MKLQNILLVISLLLFSVSLSAQTCTDGIKNGDEIDVDCGGSCGNLCIGDITHDINSSGSNFEAADANNLKIRGGSSTSKKEIFLKFDVPGSPGDIIDSVQLELRNGSVSISNITVYQSSNVTWTQNDIASNTPTYTSNDEIANENDAVIMGNSQAIWTLDKSNFSPGDSVTLILSRASSNSNQSAYLSLESGNNRPILKVFFASGGGGGNTPPSVSFSQPSNGASFTEGTPIDVDIMATDNDGTVSSVDLQVDGISQTGGSQNMSTYSWTLTGLTPDTYELKAIATDDDGATSMTTISITVDPMGGGGGSGTSLWSQVNNSNNIYYDSGNVGIGTATPSELLHVAGEIYAVRVRVNADAGADFVFEEGYQLMTLEEVEAYVKKNKHLPEIPSEQEMIDNDLQLGEFSIKLLQKVEELTLYMIEMKKENDQLKTKNAELEKRLEQLEKQ